MLDGDLAIPYTVFIKTRYNFTGESNMWTLLIWETENAQVEIREYEYLSPAYLLASRGGYYKAQIVNEFGVIEYEF